MKAKAMREGEAKAMREGETKVMREGESKVMREGESKARRKWIRVGEMRLRNRECNLEDGFVHDVYELVVLEVCFGDGSGCVVVLVFFLVVLVIFLFGGLLLFVIGGLVFFLFGGLLLFVIGGLVFFGVVVLVVVGGLLCGLFVVEGVLEGSELMLEAASSVILKLASFGG